MIRIAIPLGRTRLLPARRRLLLPLLASRVCGHRAAGRIFLARARERMHHTRRLAQPVPLITDDFIFLYARVGKFHSSIKPMIMGTGAINTNGERKDYRGSDFLQTWL